MKWRDVQRKEETLHLIIINDRVPFTNRLKNRSLMGHFHSKTIGSLSLRHR